MGAVGADMKLAGGQGVQFHRFTFTSCHPVLSSGMAAENESGVDKLKMEAVHPAIKLNKSYHNPDFWSV